MPSQAEQGSGLRKVGDILEFLALVELSDIVVHEERTRRIYWSEEEASNLDLPMSENTLVTQSDGTLFRFRFRMVFADENAEYVADIESVYESNEPVSIGAPITADFASRVAFMAVYPFLRASIFYSAHRLGLPAPLLAMVRQGEFSIEGDMTPDVVKQTFVGAKSELSPNRFVSESATD